MAIKTRLEDMVIGDKVIANYESKVSGAIGIFAPSEFAYRKSTDYLTMIPIISSDKPSGFFQFIYVGNDFKGRMILIADRNIQHSISWDTLNKAGISTQGGIQVDLGLDSTKWKTNIRLLTGGVSDVLKANSEWDKYIVNGPMGNSSDIWNWRSIYSWTSTTDTSNSLWRILRGNTSASVFSNNASSLQTITYGFRPVLVAESLAISQPITNKYLFQDGEDIKKGIKNSSPAWDSTKSSAAISLTNNNLTAAVPNYDNTVKASKGITSGKWYWEVAVGVANALMVGVSNLNAITTGSNYSTKNVRYYYENGNRYPGAYSYGTSLTHGDIIGVALDMDNGTIEFFKNGVSQGIAFNDLIGMGELFPTISSGGSIQGPTVTAKFDKTQLSYSPPIGFNLYANPFNWSVVGSTPVTKSMFDEHGMTDLSIINNEAIQGLVSDTPELLCWTDEEGEVVSCKANLTAIPHPQLLLPTGDISVGELESVKVEAKASSGDASVSLVPSMTANTQGLFTASASSVFSSPIFDPYKAFDGSNNSNSTSDAFFFQGTSGWLKMDFGKSTLIDKYRIGAYSNSMSAISAMIKDWTFEGSNDDLNWAVLDTRKSISWSFLEYKEWLPIATTNYRYYRLNVTANNGHANLAGLAELQLYGKKNVDNLKMIASPDSGTSWQGKSPVTVSDLASIKANGWTPAEFNALTKEELAALFPNGKVRLGFYLEKDKVTDTLEIQSVSVNEVEYKVTPSVQGLSALYEALSAEKPLFYVSRDGGANWTEATADQLMKLDSLPEGKDLQVKAVLTGGQELHGISFSWI